MKLALAGVVAAFAAATLLFGDLGRGGGTAVAAPRDAEAAVQRGLVALEGARVRVDPSRYPVAEREFEEALRIGGADAAAYRGLAGLAAARHRFADSLRLAERARRLAPEVAAVYGLLGDANLELGRHGAAHRAFDRMVALKPGPTGYARISYARELLGDTAGAVEAMRLAADSTGGAEPTAWALTLLGNLYAGSGRPARATAEYRAALERVPGYAPALVGLAELAQRGADLPRAERLLRRALATVDDPGAAASLGDVLAASGDDAGAKHWWNRAHALERRFARYGGDNAVETALFDLDHDRNLREALVRARAGAARRPGVEGLHTLAWALYKNGRCAEAVAPSDRALALAPTDTGSLAHRALIERCLGDGAAASRFDERARAIDPTFPAPSPFRLR